MSYKKVFTAIAFAVGLAAACAPESFAQLSGKYDSKETLANRMYNSAQYNNGVNDFSRYFVDNENKVFQVYNLAADGFRYEFMGYVGKKIKGGTIGCDILKDESVDYYVEFQVEGDTLIAHGQEVHYDCNNANTKIFNGQARFTSRTFESR
ncbi:hypothetical protein KR52_05755 [Synechococcus sp. KORDI-52]|uniref:hypothetical protein n=1 Tax=Synechococcus sp. KORDI-52 TaxID=585425 RepID=UPI0004E0A4A2|nr:hypothetical protein [Synechococcus sp. KORDI-52]AII48646.1 hypothetical protein KR52_05755 [Synechococcus sp. KORDI-52]